MSRFSRCALLFALVFASLTAFASQAGAMPPPPQNECLELGVNAIAGYNCNTLVSSLSYYKGWGQTQHYCVGGAYNENLVIPTLTGWRWTSTGWRGVTLARSTWVYVWPYATGWSWVWTQSTGWLAFQDRYLVINQTGCPLVPMAAPGARVP